MGRREGIWSSTKESSSLKITTRSRFQQVINKRSGDDAMTADVWAIGVDLGGTKVEVAAVDSGGRLHHQLRRSTNVEAGPAAIQADIVAAARDLSERTGSPPVGVGVGVAGQIDPEQGVVRFAPNLGWRDVPLQKDLREALGWPVVVTNDVRAATWGEWLHGAGQGCDDLICLFVGTGIGGGVVSGGKILKGCTNTAGELGHIVIDTNGPSCTCGNRGCLEAFAGGWAIARQAQKAISLDRSAGTYLLNSAGGQLERVTAEFVARGANAGDPLALRVIDEATKALIVGAVSLVNAFNPCRFILGGGVVEGWPYLVGQIDQGVRKQALAAATHSLQVLPAKLKNSAGVVGAASLAIRSFTK
jgi:glucokinase